MAKKKQLSIILQQMTKRNFKKMVHVQDLGDKAMNFNF